MENQVPPKKEITKIPDLNASIRKKSKLKRIIDIFIADDVQDIKSYAVYDVLIPNVRDTLFSLLNNSLTMLFYGGKGSKQVKKPGATYVSYNDYSSGKARTPIQRPDSRSLYSDNEIFIPDDEKGPVYTKAKAESVIDVLNELIDKYGKADMYDLYDALEITNRSYTNHNYGWIEMITTRPQRVRGGYVIRLPRPVEL